MKFDSKRVSINRRAQAKRELGEWLIGRAEGCVRSNYPELGDDDVNFLARLILHEIAVEQFEKSKAGIRT